MSAKTLKELKEEIRLLPDQYKEALENQTQKFLKVERLEKQIDDLKKALSLENNTNVSDESEDTDEDSSLLGLETNLEKLKLKLSNTEFNVELNSRKTTEKVTESTIKAIVGTDDEVFKLRNQLIDDQATLKARKSELNRQRQDRREKDRLNRWQTKSTPESEELDELENQLFIAKSEQLAANDEVELLKIKLESYRLLVGLESLEDVDR